jgi:plastocyanin
VSPVVKLALRAVSAVAAGSLVATGCADDGPRPVVAAATATDPAVAAPTATVTVVAADNRFDPERIEIAPGTEVVWVNRGRNDHDLMTELGFGVTVADFHPGDEYRHVFTEPGEYPYYCTIHGTAEVGMIGTVVVTDTA